MGDRQVLGVSVGDRWLAGCGSYRQEQRMAAMSTSLLLLYTQCKITVGVILNTQALNDMSHNKRCLPDDWRGGGMVRNFARKSTS